VAAVLAPVHARVRVQHRLLAVSLGGLVAAPGRGDRGQRQHHDLQDLDDLFPAVLLPVRLLLLAEPVGDLDIHLLRHARASPGAMSGQHRQTPIYLPSSGQDEKQSTS
jgi:hypothetical protein